MISARLASTRGRDRSGVTMRRVPLVLAAVALLLLLALRRWSNPASAVSRQPAAKFRWRTSQFGRDSEGFARPSVPCGARILVAHEQHLQAVGSDVRLLWLLLLLRALDAEVSLLLRAATPAARRSPPTAELAALLGAAGDVAHVLRDNATAPTPPALYELGDSAALAALLGAGHFDLVLLGVWFGDPQPAFAELLLPVIQAYAGGGRRATRPIRAPPPPRRTTMAATRRRPAVAAAVRPSRAVLDDAHAERAHAWRRRRRTVELAHLSRSRAISARGRGRSTPPTAALPDGDRHGGRRAAARRARRGLRMDARLLRMPAQVGEFDGGGFRGECDGFGPGGAAHRLCGRRRTPTNTSGSSDFCARAGRCCVRCRRARGCALSAASLTPIGRARQPRGAAALRGGDALRVGVVDAVRGECECLRRRCPRISERGGAAARSGPLAAARGADLC